MSQERAEQTRSESDPDAKRKARYKEWNSYHAAEYRDAQGTHSGNRRNGKAPLSDAEIMSHYDDPVAPYFPVDPVAPPPSPVLGGDG